MTTEQIYNKIIAEKESGLYPELDELNSTSKVAIWRLFIWVFSFASKTVQELFDSFKLYIESFFAKSQTGTLLWWSEQARNFQFGDLLEFIDGIFQYAVIDELKQIVKQVAIETLDAVLIFKVANSDGAGNLIPLTASEQTALLAYINRIKFPGTFTSVYSAAGDDLKLNYRIYYNAERTESDVVSDIENTVNDYLSNLVFNGKFQHTELTDVLQQIGGVKFPIYDSGFAKPDGTLEADYVEIIDNHIAASGYFKISELNLEMIPNV